MIKYYILEDEIGFNHTFYIQTNIQDLPIHIVKKYEDIDFSNNFKIVPITVMDILKYNKNVNNVFFRTNSLNIVLFDNKSVFTEFMMNNFINNIPYCYYYNYDNFSYISNNIDEEQKIQKPNSDYSGKGIIITNHVNSHLKNIVVSKYHEHSFYYVGHFLVKNGKILKQIVFKSSQNNDKKFIKRGNITDFTIFEKITDICNDTIFENIFSKLKYTGFACSDFIIENDKIIIFEINPRLGGSITRTVKPLNDLFKVIIDNFS